MPRSAETGDRLITDHVNHYVTDGDVAVAELVEMADASGQHLQRQQ